MNSSDIKDVLSGFMLLAGFLGIAWAIAWGNTCTARQAMEAGYVQEVITHTRTVDNTDVIWVKKHE